MSPSTVPASGTYTADPVHSSLEFAVRHMGVQTFRARFDDVDARLALDDGPRLEGTARVESVSIRRPQEFRDHVVFGEDFLDGRHHPEITFASTEVLLADDGTADVRGGLTIRGVTRPVHAMGRHEAPVDDPYGGRRTALSLRADLDRREWGMGWQMPLPAGGDVLGWQVRLDIALELVAEERA